MFSSHLCQQASSSGPPPLPCSVGSTLLSPSSLVSSKKPLVHPNVCAKLCAGKRECRVRCDLTSTPLEGLMQSQQETDLLGDGARYHDGNQAPRIEGLRGGQLPQPSHLVTLVLLMKKYVGPFLRSTSFPLICLFILHPHRTV